MGSTALNYHEWPICAPACSCGGETDVPFSRFLKDALVRRYGEDWYRELETIYTVGSARGGSSDDVRAAR